MHKVEKKSKNNKSDKEDVNVAESVFPKIVTSDSASAFYKEALSSFENGVTATAIVASTDITGRYRVLDIEPDKRTISYKTKNGAISYKTLTHVLAGKSISFGVSISSKGKIELYLFGDSGDTDCSFLARAFVSQEVIDPMFAVIDDNSLYLIYNRPSKQAMASSVSNRVPSLENNVASASGAPGIIRFDLAELETADVLGEIESLGKYACGVYFDEESNQPRLIIANLYGTNDKKEDKPSLRDLLHSIVEDSYISMSYTLPIGILTLGFVEQAEIIQYDKDTDPSYGVDSIILQDSNENGFHAFYLEGAETFSTLESEKEEKRDTEKAERCKIND